jgi:NAD dependent epimerase/dehydratase family enzyme
MEPLFKWVPGGAAPVGSHSPFLPATGRQWMSWVHLDDLVGLILLAIDNPAASGPLNGTAPNPVTNSDFSRQLASALHRPFLPFGPPNALLRLLLGEVASTVIESQRVLPKAAGRLGYPFHFPVLVSALANLYGSRRG